MYKCIYFNLFEFILHCFNWATINTVDRQQRRQSVSGLLKSHDDIS
jgi:hypothetical protein